MGLSVDYSTHIIISYATSRAKGTYFRTRYAFLELGVSIVGGASTSLLSSSFLFGALLPFFTIFGSTLFLSLLIAFVYTMLFLPPMLIVFGPEAYPEGDFYVWLQESVFGSESGGSSGSDKGGGEGEGVEMGAVGRRGLQEGGGEADAKGQANPVAALVGGVSP